MRSTGDETRPNGACALEPIAAERGLESLEADGASAAGMNARFFRSSLTPIDDVMKNTASAIDAPNERPSTGALR